MQQAILKKSWKQRPTKQQVYSHLPPIPKTNQIRQTRHARHCWKSKDKLISMFSDGPLHNDMQVLADQQKLIHNSSIWIQDIDLPKAMKDRGKCQESVKEIYVSRAT